MADTTFQLTQPKVERKFNPRDIVGGTFEDIFETVIGTGEGFLVNEGQIRNQSPEISDSSAIEGSGLAIGGRTEISFNSPEKVQLREARWIIQRMRITEQAVSQQRRRREITPGQVMDDVDAMSDPDLAKMGDFNNESLTDKLLLRSVANKMWVFFKKAAMILKRKKAGTAISIAETRTKGKSALQGMFEGGSGSLGQGQGNLSFQATG